MAFKDNLKIIREFRGKKKAEIAKCLGIGRQNLTNWETGPNEPGSDILDNLSNCLQVPRELLYKKDLTKEYLEKNFSGENHTSMPKADDNNGKVDTSMEEAIRHLIEGNTEYILMHKVVILDKYRLVSVEDLEKADKELERKQDQITGLYEIIKTITSKLPDPVKLPEVQKA